MENFINKENSNAETPKVSEKWKDKTDEQRIFEINEYIKHNKINNNYEVFNALEDGQVILKTDKSIPAKERGVNLLELEEKLKKSVDKGITVWLEPIGDKSKLRNLRGITFKNL